MNEIETIDYKINRKNKIASWVWLIVAVIYTFLPIDAFPEALAPVIGYIDDFLVSSAALINFIQQQFFQGSNTLNKIFKIVKWILISLIILSFLITVLIITLIVKS